MKIQPHVSWPLGGILMHFEARLASFHLLSRPRKPPFSKVFAPLRRRRLPRPPTRTAGLPQPGSASREPGSGRLRGVFVGYEGLTDGLQAGHWQQVAAAGEAVQWQGAVWHHALLLLRGPDQSRGAVKGGEWIENILKSSQINKDSMKDNGNE